MKAKLAEALLRRKELQQKVDQLRHIKDSQLVEIKINRQQVTENVDNIVAQVPKVDVSQITAEYDYYAKHLRLVDAAIQQANWTTEIDLDDLSMKNYLETK